MLEKYIQEAFQNAAVNGELYNDKFNETLACLEDFNIKRLRDTPLGQRLFRAFDSVPKILINLIFYNKNRIKAIQLALLSFWKVWKHLFKIKKPELIVDISLK